MRLNQLSLKEIGCSLREVQRQFPEINAELAVWRDPMRDVIVENMMDGYGYVNQLLETQIDPFSSSGLHHLLELNHIVLCGLRDRVREEHQKHILATTNRFYEQAGCNIGDIVAWYRHNGHRSAWKKAAGVYTLLLSRPQLFFEGNHRTGALIMSLILVWGGHPPFVLNVGNARAYFDPSTLVKHAQVNVFTQLWKLPKLRKRFAEFLKRQAEEKYLIRTGTTIS